jgi:salicylate hydroxylase
MVISRPKQREPSMTMYPVVIIGGGIAGLSTALALAKKNHRVLIVEQRTDSIEAGAGLQLSPNASHILIDWGLGPSLARTAVAPTELAIRRWGEPRAFARMPFNTNDHSQKTVAPFWVMLRADLHSTLKAAVLREPLIEMRHGLSLERFVDDGKALTLRFNAEAETIEIKTLCVIGADGQRSSFRRILGDARDLETPGWEAWRTLIPAETAPDFIRAATTNLWLGRDSHAVHYPVAAGKLINLVVIRKSANAESGWNRQADPALLQPLIQKAAPTLRDLMTSAPEWSVWTLHDRATSPYFAKGAAALVGDAAHPLMPFLAQGAAMAIEDAAVLAEALPGYDAFNRPSIEAGLKAFVAKRAPRVREVFKAARANALSYHLPTPLAWVRDKRMAQLGPDGMRQRYTWLYDWRLESH